MTEHVKRNPYSFVLISCWFLLIGAALFRSYAGTIEGEMLPVMTAMEVQGIEKDRYGSILSVGMTKLRDCSFEDMQWYVDTEKGRAKLSALSMNHNPVGPNEKVEADIFVNVDENGRATPHGLTIEVTDPADLPVLDRALALRKAADSAEKLE